MRLARLRLKNFRCYRDECTIDFDEMTAIIGRNDAGKSSIMDALEIFFEEAKLDKDDASVGGDKANVEIACEFVELPPSAVIDEDFPTSFTDEFLLNDQGRLEIVKTYNGSLATPKQTGTFARARHPTADGYADLLQLKRTELVARAEELGVDLSSVNKKANAPIRDAIRRHAVDLELAEDLVSLDKEDAKQVWTQVSACLPAFALFKSDRASTDQDPEAQDPLRAAIRDALKEHEPDLAKIADYVEAEVRKIADETVEKLQEMDPSLADALSPVITTKKWDSLFQTSISDGMGIPINKRGSGVKRLILLNFFRAKAERAASKTVQCRKRDDVEPQIAWARKALNRSVGSFGLWKESHSSVNPSQSSGDMTCSNRTGGTGTPPVTCAALGTAEAALGSMSTNALSIGLSGSSIGLSRSPSWVSPRLAVRMLVVGTRSRWLPTRAFILVFRGDYAKRFATAKALSTRSSTLVRSA